MSSPRRAVSVPASRRLLELLEEHRLTPTQRRIAQCLIEHASEAPFLSSGELASLAGVSQPSVTRFAVALGFDGFPALRRHLRVVLGGPAAESPAEARHNVWQAAVASELENLGRLAELLVDPEPLERAGSLAMQSRPLVVAGVRASTPVASFLAYFAAKIHPDVRLVDDGGSGALDKVEQAVDAGASALVGFVLPRYPREAIGLLESAKSLGLALVVVTDSPVGPPADLGDVVLSVPVGSKLVFDSHAGPAVLASLLVQAMVDAEPKEAQARLERFEVQAARRGVFEP